MKKNVLNPGVMLLVLVLGAASGCGDSDSGTKQPDQSNSWPKTGPIAPECSGNDSDWCGQAHASASLTCKDPDGKDYSITTTFSGKTDSVACGVEDNGDLVLRVGPPQSQTEAYNTHSVQFRLRNYTGGGTYELTRSSEEDSDYGLELQGKAGGIRASQGSESVGTTACGPSPCKAIVAPESETIPHGDSVQEFRVRVEVQCDPAAGSLWWNPDCDGTACQLTGTPEFYFDVQCTN